jgi:hypothetical protein
VESVRVVEAYGIESLKRGDSLISITAGIKALSEHWKPIKLACATLLALLIREFDPDRNAEEHHLAIEKEVNDAVYETVHYDPYKTVEAYQRYVWNQALYEAMIIDKSCQVLIDIGDEKKNPRNPRIYSLFESKIGQIRTASRYKDPFLVIRRIEFPDADAKDEKGSIAEALDRMTSGFLTTIAAYKELQQYARQVIEYLKTLFTPREISLLEGEAEKDINTSLNFESFPSFKQL